MRSDIRIRRIDADEWMLFRNLRLAALRDSPDAFETTFDYWKDANEARWRGRLDGVAFNVVAELDSGPAGMVSAIAPRPDGTVELISLWVSPEARGRGVGDALVEAVVQWANEHAASSVLLGVRAANLPAIALYRRRGFVDPPPEHTSLENSACEIWLTRPSVTA